MQPTDPRAPPGACYACPGVTGEHLYPGACGVSLTARSTEGVPQGVGAAILRHDAMSCQARRLRR